MINQFLQEHHTFVLFFLNTGWGKRGDAVIDDESDDPYVLHDNLAHAWFEDQ